MRSLQEVLLEREMKTVKTVKPPDAAGRHTTETAKTTETGKERLSQSRVARWPGGPCRWGCTPCAPTAFIPFIPNSYSFAIHLLFICYSLAIILWIPMQRTCQVEHGFVMWGLDGMQISKTWQCSPWILSCMVSWFASLLNWFMNDINEICINCNNLAHSVLLGCGCLFVLSSLALVWCDFL